MTQRREKIDQSKEPDMQAKSWICIRCSQVNAPWMPYCSCKAASQIPNNNLTCGFCYGSGWLFDDTTAGRTKCHYCYFSTAKPWTAEDKSEARLTEAEINELAELLNKNNPDYLLSNFGKNLVKDKLAGQVQALLKEIETLKIVLGSMEASLDEAHLILDEAGIKRKHPDDEGTCIGFTVAKRIKILLDKDRVR